MFSSPIEPHHALLRYHLEAAKLAVDYAEERLGNAVSTLLASLTASSNADTTAEDIGQRLRNMLSPL